MKIKHSDAIPRSAFRASGAGRKIDNGVRFTTAALGLACAAGVFGLLALLYQVN